MSRQPTRTDLVEANEAEVRRLEDLSTDVKTEARAYRDLSELISTFPPSTPFHVAAAEELSKIASEHSDRLVMYSDEVARQAAELRERGIR